MVNQKIISKGGKRFEVSLEYYIKTNFWLFHYDVIKWKYFPRYWPFVRGIRR